MNRRLEKTVIRNFVIYTIRQILLGYQIKEDEMGGEYSTYPYKIVVGKPEETSRQT
jgi:hypothetical protein